MYQLYHFPFSQHARRVVSLLEEAHLDYELRHVAMDRGEHVSAEYLAINPNHKVPTLLDGDIKIHESNAILRYLCAKHGLDSWYPSELPARAAVEEWLDWNQCQLSPAVVDVVLNQVFLGDNGDAEAIQRGTQRLTELTPLLEAHLTQRPYLAGTHPTIADLSIASNIFHLSLAGAQPTTPSIAAWYAKVSALPGFQKSLPPAPQA